MILENGDNAESIVCHIDNENIRNRKRMQQVQIGTLTSVFYSTRGANIYHLSDAMISS